VKLHYRVDGPDGAPALVFSNSLGTTLEMWDAQADALAGAWRVVRYDQRGHGRSPVPPGPYTIDELGGDLLELLDDLGLERVAFCGLSLGGVIGMWLGANAPARVERLVLCCTSAYFGAPELWNERAATARASGPAVMVDAILARWFGEGFRAERPDEVERIAEMLREMPGEGYAACCEAIRDWDFRDRLGEVRAPTLVVAGEHDPATPPTQAEVIAGGIPGARLSILDSAHLANIERADEVTRLISEHLA